MTKQPDIKCRFDVIKWGLIVLLLVTGVVTNSYYGAQPVALRAIAWVLLLSVVFVVALLTAKGQHALAFAREAQHELRKVVWPTKQETVRTTLMVIAMVILVGMFLWGADSLFLWIVGKLTRLA